MKLYNALFDSINEIKIILSSAGLVEGVTLTPEQLKTSKKVLFWHIEVRSEEASRKSAYATFNVISIDPFTYADGKIIAYKVVFDLSIFTNKEDIKSLIQQIDLKAEENGWAFDLSAGITYEQASRLFSYSFNLSKVISYGD